MNDVGNIFYADIIDNIGKRIKFFVLAYNSCENQNAKGQLTVKCRSVVAVLATQSLFQFNWLFTQNYDKNSLQVADVPKIIIGKLKLKCRLSLDTVDFIYFVV